VTTREWPPWPDDINMRTWPVFSVFCLERPTDFFVVCVYITVVFWYWHKTVQHCLCLHLRAHREERQTAVPGRPGLVWTQRCGEVSEGGKTGVGRCEGAFTVACVMRWFIVWTTYSAATHCAYVTLSINRRLSGTFVERRWFSNYGQNHEFAFGHCVVHLGVWFVGYNMCCCFLRI